MTSLFGRIIAAEQLDVRLSVSTGLMLFSEPCGRGKLYQRNQGSSTAARSSDVLYGRAYARSRSIVWINRSAFPLVRGVYGFVRLCFGAELRHGVGEFGFVTLAFATIVLTHAAYWLRVSMPFDSSELREGRSDADVSRSP